MTWLILIALLALLAGVTWKREVAGLMLLAAWLPAYLIRFEVVIPWTFLECAILVFFVVVVAKHWRRWALGWKQYVLIGLLLAGGIVGVAVAPDTIAALGLFKAYVIEPILMALAIWLLPHSTKHLLKSVLLGAGLVGALIGLIAGIQYFTGLGIPAPWNAEALRRAVAWYPYPNAVGLFLAPVAAAWLIAGWRGWLGRVELWGAVTILHIIGIAASVSEGAAAALVGALLVYIYKYRSRFLAVILTSTLLGIGLLTPPIRDVLLLQDTSGEVRQVLWQGTVRLLEAHPLEGSGLGGFPDTYNIFREARHTELLLYPHNTLLNFWTQFGVLGPLFLGAAGVLVLWPLWKRQNTSDAILLAALTAIVVYGLVDVPYFKNDLAVLVWIFLALAVKPTISDKNE